MFIKNGLRFLVLTVLYGLALPVFVLFLADIGVKIVSSPSSLEGSDGFQAFGSLIFSWVFLTAIYLVFCTLYYFIRNKKFRHRLTWGFVALPACLFLVSSGSHGGNFFFFHLTYYGLFYGLQALRHPGKKNMGEGS